MKRCAPADLRNQLVADADGFLGNNIVCYPTQQMNRSDLPEIYKSPVFYLLDQRRGLHVETLNREVYRKNYTVSRRSRLLGFFRKDWEWSVAGAYCLTSPDLGLRPMTTPTPSWCAYYLPWISDKITQITLGDGADLFFNATMDGCSFGWAAKANQTVSVAHANLCNIEGMTEDATAAELRNLNPDFSIYGPSRYRAFGDQAKCSLVGVRVQGRWRLYSQVYTEDMSSEGDVVRYAYKICNVSRLM
ncbi:hypothetical protein GAY33_05830 [Azospirillum brasilense]|uniref:hypothetical protein n=1 Tax=Azospirillum argentinense TaxID=2970906 RepID=UPI00190A96B3|nr:hypothetical protein [Azospirillum argentinense]MBK3798752.1 hypothetical protein [Azospirillum argentinense]